MVLLYRPGVDALRPLRVEDYEIDSYLDSTWMGLGMLCDDNLT